MANNGAGSDAERRSAERVAVRCPAVARVAGLPEMDGEVVNLSTLGLLIALPVELPLGVEIRVRIALPDGEAPAEVLGMVVRRSRREDDVVETGLGLISPTASAARRLSAFAFAP